MARLIGLLKTSARFLQYCFELILNNLYLQTALAMLINFVYDVQLSVSEVIPLLTD